MNARQFGRRLAGYREQRRLSTTALARQIGIDYMQIYRYEKGESLPSLETATRLARVFQISLDVLATGQEAPAPPAPPPLIRHARLLEQIRTLDALPQERQELASRILEAVIAGELDAVARRVRG
jgi:transcriptional regulator with XRE-family HTH domain